MINILTCVLNLNLNFTYIIKDKILYNNFSYIAV